MHHAARGLAREPVDGGLRYAALAEARRFEVMLQFMHGALDDDDRPIDDDAEVDGAKTHQIGPHAREAHQNEREEQRQRNERGCDDAAADAA